MDKFIKANTTEKKRNKKQTTKNMIYVCIEKQVHYIIGSVLTLHSESYTAYLLLDERTDPILNNYAKITITSTKKSK